MDLWKRLGAGALTGAVLGIALAAVLAAGRAVAGLPFPPFDLLDWLARTLPGGVVTAGIDAMVGALRAAGLSTADVAKTAERTMALGLFVGLTAVAGGALFGLWRRTPGRRDLAIAASAALVFAVAFTAADAAVSGVASGPVAGFLWLAAMGSAWVAALRWSWRRLTGAAAGVVAEAGDARSASVTVLDRRRFLLQVGGASAAVTVVGAAVALRGESSGAGNAVRGERWSAAHPLPNEGADVDPVRGTRPEYTPLEDHYQIDINTTPPRVDEAGWRLRIDGRVDRPARLSLAELRSDFTPLHQFVTLACISNRIGGSLTSTIRWTGVPLRAVLGRAGLGPAATHVRIRSADGFHEVVARDLFEDDERIMLTYAWDGVPLLAKHGFPLRIYIPDRYGMKQPKWIESLEAMDHWEEGYWVRRGWDRDAIMRATSVIDTIDTDMMLSEADGTTLIPVGGIAHAGARGISRVEIQVDDGPWEAARLRSPLSGLTWVIWRYEWPFREGDHTLRVRCVDGRGTPQVEERSGVRPDGATGLHHMDVML